MFDLAVLIRNIDRRLEQMGISAKQFADALKAGLSDSYISQLKTGKSDNPRLDQLSKLGDALELTLLQLLDGSDSDPVEQAQAEVLAAYDSISDEQRKAIMDMMKAMAPRQSDEMTPVRINRLMGYIPLDDLSMDVVEQELLAALLAIRRRQAELNSAAREAPDLPLRWGEAPHKIAMRTAGGWSRSRVRRGRPDEDEKGVANFRTPGGEQEHLIVNAGPRGPAR